MAWRERYEIEAASAQAMFDQKPVDELLDRAANRMYGKYFSIWRSIAERAELEQAGWLMFEVLQTEQDYLTRYHCAAALLALMGLDRADAVRHSADSADRHNNLLDLETELSGRIGQSRA
jgi:hypothetical protein